MNVGIQTPDVIHNLEQLQTDDINLELPSIDPATLTPTYGIEAGWVRQGIIAANTGGHSINGTTVSLSDSVPADFTLRYDSNQVGAIDIDHARYYTYIEARLTGGVVSPIEINFRIDLPNSMSVTLLVRNLVNPGRIMVGPIYIPVGWNLQGLTRTNGGGADEFSMSIVGIQAPSGVPISLIPPIHLDVGA